MPTSESWIGIAGASACSCPDRPGAELREASPAAATRRATGIEAGQAENVDVLRSGKLLRPDREGGTPDPLHVGRPLRGEDVVDVAPRSHEFTAPVAVGMLIPRVPVAVHLLREAQQHGPPEGCQRPRPGADVGVELPVDDVAQLIARLRLVKTLAGIPRLPGDLGNTAAPGDRGQLSGGRPAVVLPVGVPHHDLRMNMRGALESADRAKVTLPPLPPPVLRQGGRGYAKRDVGRHGPHRRPLGCRVPKQRAGAGLNGQQCEQPGDEQQRDERDRRALADAPRSGGPAMDRVVHRST